MNGDGVITLINEALLCDNTIKKEARAFIAYCEVCCKWHIVDKNTKNPCVFSLKEKYRKYLDEYPDRV